MKSLEVNELIILWRLTMNKAVRYNTGKTRFDLIILKDVVDSISPHHLDLNQGLALNVLRNVASFQLDKDITHLDTILPNLVDYWYECANVFEYGAKKYSDWNWTKGMNWSYYIASLSRHLLSIILEEVLIDDESGYSHFGHVLCNLVMFRHNIQNYPELDDIPDFNIKGA